MPALLDQLAQRGNVIGRREAGRDATDEVRQRLDAGLQLLQGLKLESLCAGEGDEVTMICGGYTGNPGNVLDYWSAESATT